MDDKLIVLDNKINLMPLHNEDYISLTDIAGYKDTQRTDDVIRNWIRNRNTIEFLGIWEELHNEKFKPVEFDGIKKIAGLNSFTLTPKKWIEKTNAIGVISKPGRYGGTYVHKNIAFEFASWISPKFKLYLIMEFERLKKEEIDKNKLEWDFKRNLAKINYNIHAFSIKENLIPKKISIEQERMIYANEAEILNVALFGITSQQWKFKNPDKKGNIRDYANASQLVCLSNLESLNSLFINEGINQKDRLIKLNDVAIYQMKILANDLNVKSFGEEYEND